MDTKYANILNRVLVTPYTLDNSPETCYLLHDPGTDRVCLTTCGGPVYYDSIEECNAANADCMDCYHFGDTYPSILDYWFAVHADLPKYGDDDSTHEVLRSCFGAGAAEWITSLPLKNPHSVQIGYYKPILDALDTTRAEIARELLRLMLDDEDQIRQERRRMPDEIADGCERSLKGQIRGLDRAFAVVTGMMTGQCHMKILLDDVFAESNEHA